jgi:hypothetical protein
VEQVMGEWNKWWVLVNDSPVHQTDMELSSVGISLRPSSWTDLRLVPTAPTA